MTVGTGTDGAGRADPAPEVALGGHRPPKPFYVWEQPLRRSRSKRDGIDGAVLTALRRGIGLEAGTVPEMWPFYRELNDRGHLTHRLRAEHVVRLAAERPRGARVAHRTAAHRITNAELARNHLLNGVGAGKGYGCGLITLAPVCP
jgi:CRISPR associated protein